MSNLTPAQNDAVTKKGKNIIVSAGAGSGKTTVLKSRVLRILKDDKKNINNLIILTFTNNAASEMKERIRKIISENEEVKDQAMYLDSAYITTFDSYAQSLVKKYNYLLNISKDFKIIDESIVNMELNNILDSIFEELYHIRDEKFLTLIKNFEVKNDKRIKKVIIKYYKALENLVDRKTFLESYIDIHFSDSYIDEIFNKFENIIFNLVNQYIEKLEELNDYTISNNAIDFNTNLQSKLSSISSYDELLTIDLAIAKANKNVYDEESTEIRNELKKLRDKIKAYLSEDKKTLIDHYKLTKDNIEAIIKILTILDQEIMNFKHNHNSYEFHDIALKAIELVKNNESIREEIKNSTYEIMIDEYQDTSDIQEEFISYIANNNVYMVGDVKQSIYRFRNANPKIFKSKYDTYSNNIDGIKIDLNANFRSRKEVVNDINLIFDNIMFDDIGGSKYKEEHELIPGNKMYLEHINNKSYQTEILTYNNSDKKYKQNEIEAFIIANDILKRIKKEEKVTYMEGNEMKSRDCEYRDFTILIDESKHFTTIKKVLEFHNIPAVILKDISVKDEDEIFILKNLINLIIKIKEKTFDNDFIHYYLSIGRSYIFKMSDQELFDIAKNKTFKETKLYKKLEVIASDIDSLSNKEILIKLINDFDIINKLILVGDIDERSTKLEYFINNAESLNNFGMNIYEMSNYFEELLSGDDDIKMTSGKETDTNAVKILTTYGSKGLEYPYVYLPFLNTNFITDRDRSKFKFNNSYGFIIPFFNMGIGTTFIHEINKYEQNIETLSERIRLFYVALTRAKEKLILINEFNERIIPSTSITSSSLIDAKSYSDILSIIKYKINDFVINIHLDDLNISNNYNLIKDSNYHMKINNSKVVLEVTPLDLNNKVLESKHFSKSLSKIIDAKFKERLEFGTFMHYIFEVYDFQNDNINDLDIDDIYKDKIRNFLKHEEVKNIKNAITYKEYEIMFNKDNSTYHGFIDLLVKYDDHFDIIDYKLSNIDSKEYVIQLTGYKDYIEEKFHMPVNIYLYSINKDILKKLN